jgi:hypothetical protein
MKISVNFGLLEALSRCWENAITRIYFKFLIFVDSLISPGSSVSIVSDYELDDCAIEVRTPAEAKRFLPLASVSRPALGPTQPRV